MENMDKGLTVPKWVLIVWPKIPQMPRHLSAQFVCPSQIVLDFNEIRLQWTSIVRARERLKNALITLWNACYVFDENKLISPLILISSKWLGSSWPFDPYAYRQKLNGNNWASTDAFCVAVKRAKKEKNVSPKLMFIQLWSFETLNKNRSKSTKQYWRLKVYPVKLKWLMQNQNFDLLVHILPQFGHVKIFSIHAIMDFVYMYHLVSNRNVLY